MELLGQAFQRRSAVCCLRTMSTRRATRSLPELTTEKLYPARSDGKLRHHHADHHFGHSAISVLTTGSRRRRAAHGQSVAWNDYSISKVQRLVNADEWRLHASGLETRGKTDHGELRRRRDQTVAVIKELTAFVHEPIFDHDTPLTNA